MRAATITVVLTGQDPVTGSYAAGNVIELEGMSITINRVRTNAATMSVSTGQDIALAVGQVANLDNDAGTVALDEIAEVDD